MGRNTLFFVLQAEQNALERRGGRVRKGRKRISVAILHGEVLDNVCRCVRQSRFKLISEL